MGDDKIFLLLKRLYHNTINGNIPWETTERDEAFQYSFPEYTIRLAIKPNRENPNATDYFVSIYNQEGSLIEEIVDTDYPDEMIDTKSVFTYMKDTYDSARRVAMGVDRALDIILKNLKPADDEIPF